MSKPTQGLVELPGGLYVGTAEQIEVAAHPRHGTRGVRQHQRKYAVYTSVIVEVEETTERKAINDVHRTISQRFKVLESPSSRAREIR